MTYLDGSPLKGIVSPPGTCDWWSAFCPLCDEGRDFSCYDSEAAVLGRLITHLEDCSTDNGDHDGVLPAARARLAEIDTATAPNVPDAGFSWPPAATPYPDRMVPLGTLPGIDFSTGTPVCVDREAHRDYDTVIFPAVQLDLKGITAARKLLDDAERDILAYRFRLFDDDGDWTGWDIDIARCRQWLGSFPLGTGFDPDDLAGNDWLEVSRRLGQLNRFPGYGELRALLALLRSDKTPAAEESLG